MQNNYFNIDEYSQKIHRIVFEYWNQSQNKPVEEVIYNMLRKAVVKSADAIRYDIDREITGDKFAWNAISEALADCMIYLCKAMGPTWPDTYVMFGGTSNLNNLSIDTVHFIISSMFLAEVDDEDFFDAELIYTMRYVCAYAEQNNIDMASHVYNRLDTIYSKKYGKVKNE